MLRTYNFLTAVIAVTGCGSLFISGDVNPVFLLTLAALSYGYYRSYNNMPQAPKWTINSLSAATLTLFLLDAFIASDDYLVSVANLTILFQAIKSFDLREPWDNLQVFFMSLLQLIITSEFTSSILFGAVFIVFLAAFVSAIIFAHFIKAGLRDKPVLKKPMIYITLVTFSVTSLFFISTPRITGGLWGKGHKKGIRTAGFSEKVDFGSFGDVKLDPTVVMRVEMPGRNELPLYWRGMGFDYFNGESWQNTLTEKKWIYKRDGFFTFRPFDKEKAVVQQLYLEPIDTEILFALDEPAAVEAGSRVISTDETNTIYLPMKKGKQFFYTVYSTTGVARTLVKEKAYLQLPADTERIRRLAASIISGKKIPEEKASAIEGYLKKNYTYTLSTSEPPPGVSPVDDFLFGTKKGYCEHYATAMALLLRSAGIPSRLVTGFYGGEINAYGNYLIVRQSNAHSWVEAFIDNKWTRFDPTPATAVEKPSAITLYLDMLKMKWNRYVVSFSLSDQKNIFRFVTLPFRIPDMPDFRLRGFREVSAFFLTLFVLCLMIFLIYKSLKQERYAFPTVQYLKLRKLLSKKGLRITDATTPAEIKKLSAEKDLSGKTAQIIDMYEEHRFGNSKLSDEDREIYKRLLRDVESVGKKRFRQP